MKRTIITVFGSNDSNAGDPLYQMAFDVGRMIAQAGWTLCNGGYGGTMEAGARGAVSAGGHTIGVTCAVFRRSGPNAFIRQEVPTFDLLTRLNTLLHLGQAYIVLPGGSGTLLELAAVWEHMNKGLLRRRCPIVLLGEHWRPVVECVHRMQPDAAPPSVQPNAEEARRFIADHLTPPNND